MRRTPVFYPVDGAIVAGVVRRPPASLETVTAVVLGLDVVLTSLGSSGVDALRSIGGPGRWVALALLWACAVLLARRHRHGLPSRALERVAGAAVAFALVALLSAVWSVAPRLSFERAVTFVAAVSALALLAYAVERTPPLAWRLAAGVAAGTALVAGGGVLVWVFDSGAAVQPGTPEMVARWRGVGENPNTVALLCGVALPFALGLALRAVGARPRVLAWAAVALLALSILASQSRGALGGALVGVVVLAAFRPTSATSRVAVAAGGAAVLLAGAAISPTVIDRLSPPLSAAELARLNHQPVPGKGGGGGGTGVKPPQRSVATISDSGRLSAWRGAFRQANLRPGAGYGFGTEERVFLSGRYRVFQGSRPENSYLGTYMQLGGVGLLLLLLVFVAGVAGAVAAVRRRVEIGAVLLGVLAAGLTLAVVQSFVYSVGNVAMVSFWLALLLAPAVRT